jgi:hypothetical protein
MIQGGRVRLMNGCNRYCEKIYRNIPLIFFDQKPNNAMLDYG